jgi:integrase
MKFYLNGKPVRETTEPTNEQAAGKAMRQRIKNPDDYLITRLNGFPIRSIKDGWREIANRAGLPGMIFHDLRRTAARKMLWAGVSAGVVMEILGWKTLAILQRYDIVSEADLATAADKLDAVTANGHDIGHIELFDGLKGIQNWKTKYKGKNRIYE